MPDATISIGHDPAALAAFQARTPIATPLGSAEMAGLDLGLNESAIFSAHLESARALERIALRLSETLAGARRSLPGGAEGAVSSRSAFINELRQLITDEIGMPIDGTIGTIQDLTSENRLRLIFDTQISRAEGFAGWKAEQKQAVLDAAPAQELVRVGKRRVPRDWVKRWGAAGGPFYGGRLVARKDDPIWGAISRFHTPYPPFDFNSGMGLRDVTRLEALRLGVIRANDKVNPQDRKFTEDLQASVKGLQPAAIDFLKRNFGDQIEIVGDVAKWKGRS